jgi:thiamine biosynthesis lipoprotein
MRDAMAEIRRLEALMTSWRDDSEVGKINANAGKSVKVSAETFEVFEKSQWSSRLSDGAFDVSFNVMGDVWKFGDAAEDHPKLPDPKLIAARRKYIDYERIDLDEDARTVRIDKNMSIGLGGIAKGYAIDRAAAVLRGKGLSAFLAQAGGDLYGAGLKPTGEPWVSGIQDPRGPRGRFFATIELNDHAFSTAGDYARAYVLDGKRYHHIIDPHTGYPATASRSVTLWAPDALTADAIDDAVFIMGPEKGLALVESLPGVGAVIVDADNKVHISKRLDGKVHVTEAPTGGI